MIFRLTVPWGRMLHLHRQISTSGIQQDFSARAQLFRPVYLLCAFVGYHTHRT